MKNKIISLALIAGLAACSGGNPFDEADTGTGTGTGTDGGTTGGETDGGGISAGGTPPGTITPSPNSSLVRREALVEGDGSNAGNGFVTTVTLNANDTFTVDNIAFDGDRPYDRGTAVSSLSPREDGTGRFQVYEAPAEAIDPVNGRVIDQAGYRAIYGQSRNTVTNSDGSVVPTTKFAIVRTGSYINYGFGGFIYQRDTSVTLPETLQAQYIGKSAGLRDSNTSGGLMYTTADVVVDIDHDDFNDKAVIRGDGVKGVIKNRRVFDLEGNDVTSTVANTLEEGTTSIPDVGFVVKPDVLDNNGEILADIFTTSSAGARLETGKFYAIVSGDNPDEIVGVYVLEAAGNRDTSGFIVYRDDPA